jgi:hypothetical protein
MLLFLSPYLNIGVLTQVDAMKLFAVVFGSITLSIPLGNYIHQFTDAVCNPFARKRLLFWPRAVVAHIAAHLGRDSGRFCDKTFQAILVFSKAHSRMSKTSNIRGSKANVGHILEADIAFKVETIREEIANRYSYYYARIENGAIAPGFGVIFSILVIQIFGATSYIHEIPAFSPLWILFGAVAGGVPVLWRIPQLFRELDDLEVSLVDLQRDNWPNPHP